MSGLEWYDSLPSEVKQKVLRHVWPFDFDRPPVLELQRMNGRRPSDFWAEQQAWYQAEITKERQDCEARGRAQLSTLKNARDQKAKMKGYGSKADEPRVRKAQMFVDEINLRSLQWVKGNRSHDVQLTKDMLANGRAKERADYTVVITRDGMLKQVSYLGGPKDPKLPYRDGATDCFPMVRSESGPTKAT